MIVPSPNSPISLLPVPQNNKRSALSAKVWLPPAFIAIHLFSVPILVGVLVLVVVPSPNCPCQFAPQVQREPSACNAVECCPIIDKATTVHLLEFPT